MLYVLRELIAQEKMHLLPLYRRYGSEADCRIKLFDCAHMELPEMRKLILDWMDRHLVASPADPHGVPHRNSGAQLSL